MTSYAVCNSASYLAGLLLEEGELFDSTLEVGLENETDQRQLVIQRNLSGHSNLSKQLRLRYLLVDLLGEILVGSQRGVGHLVRRAENGSSEKNLGD